MSWNDFDEASALERDVLARALPLVPLVSDGSSAVMIDLAANTVTASVAVHETIGATPSGCVDLLQIRPLLVGAAWKVIDLLFEAALVQDGHAPDRTRGWSIRRKEELARGQKARPSQFSELIWQAITETYVNTVKLRHSLVHRRAHTDAANALVGRDSAGQLLKPFAATEQEALARVALRASQIVMAAQADARLTADLQRQLAILAPVHGLTLPVIELTDSLPAITVIVDPSPEPGVYRLDVPLLRRRQPFQGTRHADLVVTFRDRPGLSLLGRLEEAPHEVVLIDPEAPPHWLH